MIREDDLGLKGLKLLQDTNFFSFGIDTVILSGFVNNIKYDRVLDIGTGNAILPILLYGKNKGKQFIGVEIQKDVAELAVKNIKLNNLQDHIDIINMDISEYKVDKLFDMIVSNPPYMIKSGGKVSDNIYKAIARTEIEFDLDKLFRSTRSLLKEKGSLFIVHRSIRIVDIFSKAREYRIEPKRIRFVKSYADSATNLVLIEFIKGAKPFLTIEPDLIIYKDADGNYTDEILDIYGMKNG